MPLKFSDASIEAVNLQMVDASLKAKTTHTDYEGFLRLIADMVDYAIEGNQSYCTLGLARDGSGILLTVTQDHKKAYFAGPTLAEVSRHCSGVL